MPQNEIPIFYGAWFDCSGKKIGQGRLSREDFLRFRKVILGFDCYLFLAFDKLKETDNHRLNIRYLGENCFAAVGGGQIYSVNGSLKFASVLHVSRLEIGELIAKSNAARARRGIILSPDNNLFSHQSFFRKEPAMPAPTSCVQTGDRTFVMANRHDELLGRFELQDLQEKAVCFSKDAQWFDAMGRRIGRGDLDYMDFLRIAERLEVGEVFIVVSGKTTMSEYNGERIPTAIAQAASFLILKGALYIVARHLRSHSGNMEVGGILFRLIGWQDAGLEIYRARQVQISTKKAHSVI
ncbi:MAG: hypothetical protein A2931_00065 [Candidatus Niyogibacteria bacterium RIFCSPLOWO2_01_FULL_45_48]|uniref:Uncharacterized protein n=2 Tax=Parcubacteria group TaxID=1794811 RepID=A0A1G1ZUU5_9BACT|nr:MAG: hypothetical protein A3J53_03300 [Candidatus Harrisonbacteria bacterium RIFCSPHIGHO2_02_FULL_40_20]OGY67520.1 MAG: hypothetical protein A3I24_00290 [Candidatus Harrisonbacteria bacterium RIFCSPLOWO2_02_FULL_41_13b]OGZ30014.1 MAG: hypothetical protein A2931_00065 [Candidatus Niyogibacteria bacterium RIFCSPLOWO2_01_FULL_45_48]OHB17303.1 MAG: hypothetical protein A2734_02055 [Parcubacteria group bacterium RIFCSPHIGHO2_01_FULL_40_30]